ncbi:MAG: hypothetical protein V2J11_11225 [Desulfofustis sp.]|jgi:hypothetical protein|nr:hypothetical protein [Desulfofustis sp.]
MDAPPIKVIVSSMVITAPLYFQKDRMRLLRKIRLERDKAANVKD